MWHFTKLPHGTAAVASILFNQVAFSGLKQTPALMQACALKDGLQNLRQAEAPGVTFPTAPSEQVPLYPLPLHTS